jgi:2-hydroxy-6-oxonona-2,4-dienedioate hydrolase
MTGLIECLRAQATRRETPCGAGTTVWHVWGDARPGQPPVVLFHGGSGSWTHWVRNIQPLVAAGRQVIAADLPGFGDSASPPSGGDADALVAPLADGLNRLLGGEPCDLVGFSFGGLTAGLLLAEHPALARRLVLVGAPAMGVTPERQFELKAWRHLPTAAEQEAVHRFNLAALMLKDASLIDGLALELHIANLHARPHAAPAPGAHRHPGALAAARALPGARDLRRARRALQGLDPPAGRRLQGGRAGLPRPGADPRGGPLGAVRAARGV